MHNILTFLTILMYICYLNKQFSCLNIILQLIDIIERIFEGRISIEKCVEIELFFNFCDHLLDYDIFLPLKCLTIWQKYKILIHPSHQNHQLTKITININNLIPLYLHRPIQLPCYLISHQIIIERLTKNKSNEINESY